MIIQSADLHVGISQICLNRVNVRFGQGNESPLDGWERIARWQVGLTTQSFNNN